MKKMMMVVVGAVGLMLPALEVTSVTARQRFPWNGLVDIYVEISGTKAEQALCGCSFAATNNTTQTALVIASVKELEDTGTDTKRHFVWDAKRDVGEIKIEDVALTVDVEMLGVQLWEGGPYWATRNIGATKPEEAGYYFWWGDTVGYVKNGDQWDAVDGSVQDFKMSRNDCPTYRKLTELRGSYIEKNDLLAEKYDAARKHWGNKWRIPKLSDWEYNAQNVTVKSETRNGVKGVLIQGKDFYKDKSIFIPNCGSTNPCYSYQTYYLTRNYFSDYEFYSLLLENGSMRSGSGWAFRATVCYLYPVRAVAYIDD